MGLFRSDAVADGAVFIHFPGVLSLVIGIEVVRIKAHRRLFASVSYVMFLISCSVIIVASLLYAFRNWPSVKQEK